MSIVTMLQTQKKTPPQTNLSPKRLLTSKVTALLTRLPPANWVNLDQELRALCFG